MILLKAANREDTAQEWAFVRDMPPDENGLTNPWSGLSRHAFETAALPEMIAFSRGEGLPPGYVPETFFFLWDGQEIRGQFRLRHRLTEALRSGAGHIGYWIAPDCRGRGYGTLGLRLTLAAGAAVIPEEAFYLRVNRDNPASLRVMLKCGGMIRAEDELHYYVRIPKPPQP